MNVQEAISEFQREHKARGSTPRTVKWYGETLSRLLREDLATPIGALTPFALSRAVNVAAERGVKAATLANYDRALRGFTAWLHGVELLPRDLMKGRKRPQVRWQLRQVATSEELRKLFEVARRDKRYAERNCAILALLAGSGLRAGEVATLRLVDVDWQDSAVKVSGKTGTRLVPLDRTTLRLLRRYVTHSRRGNHPNVFLFNSRPITGRTLTLLLTRMSKRAGFDRHITPHLLRHTAATVYLRNGGDVASLRRILGHSTLATTALYLHLVPEDLQNKLERFSPLASAGVK
ncbi:tyrosine-type recombinase/integrase [Deinococcus multiflagellatus]|uniref:Tyrosine-type recombinase/integrase n=1 Tax=Deinococcus multiflagellatus TaxID=1656887 RepID=A0ABW1ZN49_9DEIO|nr:tyrosine-type recombinase/integrase [Deinococcus multiflagellatus]MBZ9715237.1 tyrosine-type recombinase/integrase [Deinococcus multiflagellatus]